MVVAFAMNDEWSIQIKNFGTVRISYDFLSRLSGYRQVGSNTPESGGVAIGRHLNSGGTLLIENFTPPQKSDKHGRCLFFRSQAHNALVQNIWQENQTITQHMLDCGTLTPNQYPNVPILINVIG